MSTIGSNSEDLILNADGGSSTIKLKINGTEKASVSSAGAFTSTTIDATKLTGALPAISAANLTAIPAANITGTLPAISGANLTGISSQGRNLIINGGFDVWQRGTSQVSATSVEQKYFADRFGIYPSGGTITADRVAFTQGQTTVPGNPNYHARVAMASGNANNWALMKTKLENPERLANQTYTISFWAKGTNPGGGNFQMYENMYHNNGVTVVPNSEIYTTVTVTSSWQKFTFTRTEAAWNSTCVLGNNNYYYWSIIQPAADNSTAAWTLDIANIQLELGSTATDFEQRTYGEELALCQRYCTVMNLKYLSFWYSSYGTYWFSETIKFPTTMRGNPSVSLVSGSFRFSHFNHSWVSDTLTSINNVQVSRPDHCLLRLTATGSHSPTDHGIYSGEGVTAFIKADAEL